MGSGNWYSGSAVCRTSLGRPRHCWVLVRTRGFPRYDRDADHRGVRRQPRHRSRLGHIPAFENIVLRPTSRAQWNTWTPNERLLAFITKVLFPLRGSPSSNTAASTQSAQSSPILTGPKTRRKFLWVWLRSLIQNMLHTQSNGTRGRLQSGPVCSPVTADCSTN